MNVVLVYDAGYGLSEELCNDLEDRAKSRLGSELLWSLYNG